MFGFQRPRFPGYLPRVALVCVLLFGPTAATVVAEAHRIRAISDLSDVLSLDGGPEHPGGFTWWVRFDTVDPRTLAGDLTFADKNGVVVDMPGPGWSAVAVPGYLNDLPGYAGERKEAWYLLRFRLPDTVHQSLALRLGQIDDRDVVYFNGIEIGRSGTWDSTVAEAYDLERLYEIPPPLLKPGQVNTLLIRVQGYSDDWGITRGTTAIGPLRVLQNEAVNAKYREVLFLIVYATVGGYFLFLFLRRRVERENLFFGLFALSLVGYQFMVSPFRWELGISFMNGKRLEYLLLYAVAPSFYSFIRFYYDFKPSRLLRWWDRLVIVLLLVHAVGALICLVYPNARLWWQVLSFVQLTWPVLFLGILAMLIGQARAGSRDAMYMIGGMLILGLGMFTDVLRSRGVINLPPVTGYAFFGFVSSMALILVNRFVRVNEEVEDLNQNLERKVEQRTEQLNKSLSEVQALKVQQDGDYFLTSLLIGPLGGNFASSRTLSLELHVTQKKRFHFRRWEAEIGGDLCALYDVTLRGRKYTVLLNGDAMGKSIQGAGGALVLGTVFKSVITRTHMDPALGKKYPEHWLKDCFLELQNVFVSFDGYMLVSAVIGLVDDVNGMLYYINAEHPGIVLYRRGEARFLEEDRMLRKFGVDDEEMDEQSWTLSTFRLQPGDVMYIGSDGRDDLEMGQTSDGKRIINEDEFLFVRLVSEHPASLEELVPSLLAAGGQTDDLSLIRVGYLEDPPFEETVIPPEYSAHRDRARALGTEERLQEAIQEMERAIAIRDEVAEDVLLLARLHRRAKNYERAAELYIHLTQLEPIETRYLYDASLMLKLSRDFIQAADFGERCRLRDPEYLKNLLNLADVYRGLKNYDRSQAMLSRVLVREPEHPEALRLKQALESRVNSG